MITIESSTGYNVIGEIIRKREADGLILALADTSAFGEVSFTVYLCREYTHNSAGRKREQRLEWLSFRDDAPSFGTRDAAIAYAMEA